MLLQEAIKNVSHLLSEDSLSKIQNFATENPTINEMVNIAIPAPTNSLIVNTSEVNEEKLAIFRDAFTVVVSPRRISGEINDNGVVDLYVEMSNGDTIRLESNKYDFNDHNSYSISTASGSVSFNFKSDRKDLNSVINEIAQNYRDIKRVNKY